MKKTTKTEVQTPNVATINIINLEVIPKASSDIFLDTIDNLESDSFKDYVMCYPDKFKDAKKGIESYVDSYVTKEIDGLSLPKDIRKSVYISASTMVSCYIQEEYIVEMVEFYRDEALADMENE